MKKLLRIGIVGAALVACVSLASAQTGTGQGGGGQRRGGGFGQRGGRQGGGNELSLVMRKDVQTDLAVSDDQKKKLDELRAKQPGFGAAGNRRRGGGAGGAGGGATGAGTGGGATGAGTGGATGAGAGGFDREAMQKRREQAHKDLAAILSETQMQRLGEISIQLQGSQALSNKEVQAKLGLSTDQVSKIKDLQDKMQAANSSLREKVRNNEMTREDSTKARETNNKAFETEAAKILTSEQNDKFKALQGKPFKADPAQSGRRGGGG